MFELHFCVGHKYIKPCKHKPGEHKGDKPYQKLHNRSQQNEIFYLLQHCTHEDGKTTGNNNKDRHQKKHREIVGDFAIHISRFLYSPNAVEGNFDVTYQIDYRPQ